MLEAIANVYGPKNLLLCAFSKSIKDELLTRLPLFDVRTIDSIGFSVCNSKLGDVKVQGKKYHWLAFRHLEKMGLTAVAAHEAADLLETAIHLQMCSMKSLTAISVLDRAKSMGYTMSLETYSAMHSILIEGRKAALRGTLNYTELLYMPYSEGWQFPTFKRVLVDEAQDLSKLRRWAIGEMAADTYGFVGDRWQSIMGFAGADTKSVDHIAREFETEMLELPVCYRCPTSHLDLASFRAPNIKARDGAPEGEIWTADSMPTLDNDTMVICRVNAPLFRLALREVTAGRKVNLAGVQISGMLNACTAALSSLGDISDFNKVADQYIEELRSVKSKEGISFSVALDTIECLREFIQTTQPTSWKQLTAKLQRLFNSSYNGPRLCSIHRSKGLGAQTAVILEPQLTPHNRATGKEQLEQEENLKYVSYTRSKQNLVMYSELLE